MKLFNVDIHVSVVEDVDVNLKQIGHEVENHVMSAHWWALNKARANRGTGTTTDGRIGYGCVNLQSWENMWWMPKPPDALTGIGKQFHAENPQLEDYDGYVCCYPPAFALLYEQFSKHVIVNMPIRYEYPFQNQPESWQMLNQYLVDGVNRGKITVVGNSVYEAKYYEYFTGQPALHISSTCEYIDRMTHRYAPQHDVFFAFGEHSGCRAAQTNVPGVRFVRDSFPNYQYNHSDIAKAKGVVWIPYNCSIMSFFEHYWLRIPMFVPTKDFFLTLWKTGLALSQGTWHANYLNGSNLPRKGTLLLDPHTADGVRQWLEFYDFYNTEEFPHVVYFDSWEQLKQQLATTNLAEVSQAMNEHNRMRKARNLSHWSKVLERVAATK